MARFAPWQRSLAAWAVALGLLLVVDYGIGSTSMLFRPHPFERSANLEKAVLGQSFSILRKVREPTPPGQRRVVMLGSSRAAMALWEEEDIGRRGAEAGQPVYFDNLSIFGSAIAELAVIAGHTGPARADLAVLAIGPTEILSPTQMSHPVRSLLGRSMDDPGGLNSWAASLDRVGRGFWNLFAYREFAREALLDFLLGRQAAEVRARFASVEDFHHDLAPADPTALERSYAQFLAEPSLQSYLEYVGPSRREPYRDALAVWTGPTPMAIEALELTLEELRTNAERVVIVLMPESALLAEDTSQEWSKPEMAAAAVAAIVDTARRLEVEVIDGRDWIPPEGFLDFHHVLPGLSGFEAIFYEEVLLEPRT